MKTLSILIMRGSVAPTRSFIYWLFALLSLLLLTGGTPIFGQIQTSVPSLSGFVQTDAIPCPPQSYVVTGTNISADVVVTAPAGFEISTNTITWVAPPNAITIGQEGPTSIPPTTIFVRLNTAVLGTHTGNIAHEATDASSVFLAVSGVRSAKSPTETSLMSDINPSLFGQSVTLTAVVTSPLPGTPTGTVTFFDGAVSLGTVSLNISASASLSTSALTFGSHDLTATYNGNSTFDVSSSSNVIQLVRGTTTTVVGSNNNPSVAGQSVTFTATVSSTFSGTPSGSVTFFDGVSSLGSSAMSGGVATLPTSALTPGSHSITATYNGDASFDGSTSSSLNQIVKAISATFLQSDHNPSVSGQSVTLTASVGSVTPGTISGTVSFFDGASPLGLPVTMSAGVATYSATYSASGGAHAFSATYNGDANYAASTSSTVNQTVNKAATGTVITSNHNPSAVGQTVTFTATVNPIAPGNGTPTGSVTFFIDGNPVGPISMTGGTATTTTSSLTLGTHSVTGDYSGDVNFNSSSSSSYADTVDATITATVGAHGSITPSGSVLAPYGGNQSFTITPAIGYQVDSLFIDGVAQAGAESYTFYTVISNHTIHATFLVSTFTVTVSSGPNGTASPLGPVSVLRADSLVVNFTADPHYHVADILLDDVSVGSGASYTLRDILADHTISVTFAVDIYTITAVAGVNGTINPSSSVPVTYNTDQSFTITPNTHYVVDSVVVDGISVGAVTNYSFTAVGSNHSIDAYFKLSPAYETRYRTFIYDSMMVKKAVPKKPVTQYWEFTLRNTLSTDLTEINIVFAKDVKQIISSGSFIVSGLKKAWQFTGGTLHPSETVVIKGRSLKPKPQVIAKLYLGPVTKTPSAKSILPDIQWSELPMPNVASVRDLAFAQSGFAAAPWIIGVARPESSKVYGWVTLKKSNDMYKSLFNKTPHALIGKGFDFIGTKPFVKAQTSLPPTKQNNKTFADLLTLKFNILLSRLRITTQGFGELRLALPSSPFDGMLLRDIATIGDSMMTYHDDFSVQQSLYFSLDSLLSGLNNAFSAPIDTTHWADSLRLTGTARLVDRPYLLDSGVPPLVVAPAVGFDLLSTEELPNDPRLEQNYPNPFNPTTRFDYTLPVETHVSLVIYNVLGQVVATLVDEVQDEGLQSVEFDATNLTSGVYFYRLSAGMFTQTRKMLLLK